LECDGISSESLEVVKFYKRIRDNPNYHRDLESYNGLIWALEKSFYELTGCLNWMSDIVRKDFNPYYRIEEGYLTCLEGPSEFFDSYISVPLMSPEEKNKEPESTIMRIKRLNKEWRGGIFEPQWYERDSLTLLWDEVIKF